MSAGSSLPLVEEAILEVLGNRDGLAGVTLLEAPPIKSEDLQSESGAWESIWLGDASTPEVEIPYTGVPVAFDETYDLDVVIQVLKRTRTESAAAAITQTATDTRCTALLGEVIGALAADPSLGIAVSDDLPMGVEALPNGWTHKGGRIPGRGDERGSRFVLKVRVTARITIT